MIYLYTQHADEVSEGQIPHVVEGLEELEPETSNQFRVAYHNGIGGSTKKKGKRQRLLGV